MRAAPEHRQPQTVRHAQTPRTSTSPLPIDKTQTTVHTSTNNPPTLQETRTQTMGRARRTPTPPYVGVKTFIFDLDHQRQCLVEHGHAHGAWWCSSVIMVAFVVVIICGSISWSMMVLICGRVSWGMVLQGVHLWSCLVGYGRVCTGRCRQQHLRCLLQLSARVLAGVEHCEARHSSSTWTICCSFSWSMDMSRGAWWCSSVIMASFVVEIICGRVLCIMVSVICDSI
jgi:hypothetical protein